MKALLSIARLSVMAASIIVLTAIRTPAVTYNANPGSLGAIPDGLGGACGTSGAPLDVTFTVSGFSGPLTHVSLNLTGTHSWVGDMDVALYSPGGLHGRLIFSRTGATAPTECGDSSNFAGPYSFTDVSPATPSWWQAAAAVDGSTVVAPGSYRVSDGGGAPGGGANALMLPTFAGMSNGQINGTWTLQVRDYGSGDTGSITAASLNLNSVFEGQHVVDMNGDTRTDWTVVRNIGGGANGQTAWFTSYNGVAGGQTDVFGIGRDLALSGDFDGDRKSDVVVWRPDPVAFFYILRSSDATFQAVQWGKTGDFSEIIGDYDGDGKTDCAVFRRGIAPGEQSFWHILKSSDGGYLPIQWGQTGDYEAPGDYDGDGRMDAAVQRGIGGSAIFYIRYFDGTFSQIVFGTPSDVIVPGDYDGDGKTDLSVRRNIGGQYHWFHDPSSIPGTQTIETVFGNNSDIIVQGDYDGDGRTDQAVWRPSLTPNQSAFYVNGSAAGFFAFAHGQNGDVPPAGFNIH